MSRVSHLIRRKGIFWFKIDLPDDLAGQPLPPTIPDNVKRLESPVRRGHLKTAVWFSLKTTLEREAKQRLGVQIAQHASLFEVARALLANGDHSAATHQTWIEPGSPVPPIGEQVATARGLTITEAFHSWSDGGGANRRRRTTRD
ncbi:hypothetical protein IVB14_04505 [Bradyrhizobium sp. 180]|uniref:DUF6538 domain-containing protein n=1 Tax=unclassified Bradyrhizobium TaxID=2631580 RepID=UPI001FF77A84|nr:MULTISPECIES: DUF6538 domain-containing protein [unclassified Bradyrhizobium]MCK1489702.1 hypothetical protein [Bradyrhizobium sp. 180]MCK1754135.1 hypothetical protein [Bradyrhizobium sp. 137]